MGEVAERVGQYVTAYSGDLQGRVARRAARGPGRHRHRRPHGDDQGQGHDGGRHARGPAGDARGRRLPQDLRDDDGDLARRRDPAGRRARGPPRRRGVAARGLRVGLGRGGGARAGGVRARGRVAGQAGPARCRGGGTARRTAARTAAGTATDGANGGTRRRTRERRLRPRAAASTPADARARPTPSPPDLRRSADRRRGGAEIAEEPPLPDEARARAAAAAQAPSRPIEAAPGAVLNVRFAREAGTDRVVSAMHAFKAVLRERPGATRVVVHVPAPGGDALPMELRGVAYDAELDRRGPPPRGRRRHRPPAGLTPPGPGSGLTRPLVRPGSWLSPGRPRAPRGPRRSGRRTRCGSR